MDHEGEGQELANGELESSERKVLYDKNAKERQVEVGSQVLLWQPGLIDKMDTAWAGPYDVVALVGETNIEIKLAGSNRSKSRIVHINMSKPYKDPSARI